MSFNDYLFNPKYNQYDWNNDLKRKKLIDDETDKMYKNNKKYQELLDKRKNNQVIVFDERKATWYEYITEFKMSCNIL